MAKTIQEALAEVQRKLDEYVLPAEANKPKPGQQSISSGSWQNKQLNTAPVGGAPIASMSSVPPSSVSRPAPRPLPRPATAAAPKPAAAPAGPSNADIYAKHGVGGNDEQAGAFFRAQSDIAARDKASASAPAPAAAAKPATTAAAKPATTAAPKPAAAPAGGSKADIMKQQQALIAQGHKIKADGIMGPQTKAALDAQSKTDSMKMGRGATAPSSSEPDASKLPGGDTGMNDREVRSANMQNASNVMANQEKSNDATAAVKDYVAQNKDELNKSAAEQDPSLKQDYTKENEPVSAESGPKKDKKKMSESALINAFLKLQETNHSNIFEAAKKAKPDYLDMDNDGNKKESMKKAIKDKKIKDYRADRDKHGEMEEELKGNQDKIDANKNGKIDSQDFKILRGKKKVEEEVEQIDERDMGNKAKKDAAVAAIGAANKDEKHLTTKGTGIRSSVADKIRGREVTSGKDRMEEEVGFSEAELAHFEAVIARKDQKGKERGIGDTVASEDLTDEYIGEAAKVTKLEPGRAKGLPATSQIPKKRGVKAGTKRGSYKGKTHRGGMSKAETSEPAEEPKGVPHVLDQIRHGHEDEHGFKTITHPASTPDKPVSKKIHRSDLHGFYDKYHNTEKPREKEKAYSDFLGKHFGDERSTAPTTKAVTTDLSKIEKSTAKGAGPKVSLGGSKLVGGLK